jgi:phospholipid transport system substrate-binding protein
MKKNVIPQSGMLGCWEVPTTGSSTRRLGGNNFFKVRTLAGILLILTMVLPALVAAEAEAPLEVVKVNLEKVLEVLRNPELQDEAAEDKKKEAIRSISDDMFHWALLSKRVLAKNWNSLTDAQQQEFVSLFKDILEKAYIDRILAYKDETIKYVSNQMLSEKKAEVVTHIISGGTPVNLTYRLGLLGGKWGVYDVIVEGVSLTSNYRTQFRDYLADKTPEQLLAHLRNKVGEE